MQLTASFIPVSGNAKIGKVSTTYAARESCPDVCPLKASGECYGNGFRTKPVWNRLSGITDDPIVIAQDEARAIDAKVKPSRNLRLHVVGDCQIDEAAAIVSAAVSRYLQRAKDLGNKVSAWTYTHAWRTVNRASWGQVSVMASCESSADVKLAWSNGYAASCIIPDFPADGKLFVRDGVRYLPCLEQSGRAADCDSCGVCFRDDTLLRTRTVIGFKPHGDKAKALAKRVAL